MVKANWDLAEKSQSAPQAGLVYDILFYPGEWVPAGRPAVVLLPPANVKVRAFVPESRIGRVQPGQEVRVRVDGVAEPYLGHVSYISPQAEFTPPVIYSRESRTKLVFMIELRFDAKAAARLHPGQPVDVVAGGAAPVSDEFAIDVHGMTKRFGPRVAVDAIDLQVRRGEICGFLGPNGSGKTTFIRMLCGLLRPDAGQGTCLGHDVITQSQAIKRAVGYMTQRFSFWEDLTIAENLDFVARIYGVPKPAASRAGELGAAGPDRLRSQLAGQLSGGWKQRLALAACLIHQPRLLLLDEPTAGVDPKARREFWEEIHHLAGRGLTFLIATHYMDEAERCHRLAYILERQAAGLRHGGGGDRPAHLTHLVGDRPALAGAGREATGTARRAAGGGVRGGLARQRRRRGLARADRGRVSRLRLRVATRPFGTGGRVHSSYGRCGRGGGDMIAPVSSSARRAAGPSWSRNSCRCGGTG